MTGFVCTNCGNDDPEGTYVESQVVAGVCTECVTNYWRTCDQCGSMIGLSDDLYESDCDALESSLFCSAECLGAAEEGAAEWDGAVQPYEGGLQAWA